MGRVTAAVVLAVAAWAMMQSDAAFAAEAAAPHNGAVDVGAEQSPDLSEAIAHGRVIAEAVCGDCHAVAPDAASPLPIAPPLYALAEKYPLEDIEEALAEGMVTGHEGMPEIELDPIQIDEFLAFLASIQTKLPSP